MSFLIGNDENPFIIPIPQNSSMTNDCIVPLAIPLNLRLLSYMSSCSVDAELPNCRQIMVCGGIDSRISNISRETYLITIIFPELKVKVE